VVLVCFERGTSAPAHQTTVLRTIAIINTTRTRLPLLLPPLLRPTLLPGPLLRLLLLLLFLPSCPHQLLLLSLV
jgi:hypothetical protein